MIFNRFFLFFLFVFFSFFCSCASPESQVISIVKEYHNTWESFSKKSWDKYLKQKGEKPNGNMNWSSFFGDYYTRGLRNSSGFSEARRGFVIIGPVEFPDIKYIRKGKDINPDWMMIRASGKIRFIGVGNLKTQERDYTYDIIVKKENNIWKIIDAKKVNNW